MDTAKRDTVHGTGAVKEGNAGGYKHGGHAHHKHGGKVHHISGHPEGTEAHHKHMAKHHAAKHKEGGSAHHHKMHEHHKHLAKMCKGGAYAVGGTVSEKVADRYENTMMEDGEHHDSVHGTGGVKMANAGGFKHGGKAHMKHGGKTHHYKKGGSIDAYDVRDTVEGGNWENRPADTTPKGKTNTKTGEVKEANAGGYKHGGHAAKKHFATGGSVNHMGSAVAMPQGRKPASRPVHINELSGTFKKGGRVKKFSGQYGSDVTSDEVDANTKAYNDAFKNQIEDDMGTAKFLRSIPSSLYQGAKNLMGMGSTSNAEQARLQSSMPAKGQGSVTKTEKSITVSNPKSGYKHGGRTKR